MNRLHRLSLDDALNLVKEARPIVNPNPKVTSISPMKINNTINPNPPKPTTQLPSKLPEPNYAPITPLSSYRLAA